MEKCKDSYEEGEDITYQVLMSKDERKYQARVMSNKWNTLIIEQEQIIALKGQIALLNSLKPKKEYPAKTKKMNKKSETITQPKAKFTSTHAWRKKKPLTHKPHTKVVSKVAWHYCTHHQA